jgi:hypothetical protein
MSMKQTYKGSYKLGDIIQFLTYADDFTTYGSEIVSTGIIIGLPNKYLSEYYKVVICGLEVDYPTWVNKEWICKKL